MANTATSNLLVSRDWKGRKVRYGLIYPALINCAWRWAWAWAWAWA